MHRLSVLGKVDLRDPAGREVRRVLAQPKRLALLVYLAANTGTAACRRDRLLGLFWPELDEEHARKSLNKAVYFLRREIGDEVLVSRNGDELEVDGAHLWCDVVAFQSAVIAGDRAQALELYGGDLLPSFYVDDAPTFDEWLETERARLRLAASCAARGLAVESEQEGKPTIAISLARRAVTLSDQDERVVRQLIALLDRLGDRAGALDAYERFARRLADEFDAEPAVETKHLMAQIRRRGREPAAEQQEVATLDVGRATMQHFTPNSEQALFEGLRSRGYDIQRELGRGATATVYLARDVKHSRSVAVKVLSPEIGGLRQGERFLTEIRVTAQLQHPNILPVFDSGDVHGVLFYVMPFVDGESLRSRLVQGGALGIPEAVSLLRDVAKALAYAQERGVVHRDIKPDNVLLTAGTAVVADFGIAKAIAAARRDAGGGRETLTHVGVSLGTPAYMAPEQAAADPATDHRADIYAWGCMAYEMLAGRPPFVATSPQQLLAAHMSDTPRPLIEPRRDAPLELCRLVMQCLEKEPAARPQSAAEVVQTLDAVSSGERSSVHPIARDPSHMLGKALAIYVAAVIVGVSIANLATEALGLPDWVFPGALIVLSLGLPVLLLTAYAHSVTTRLPAAPASAPDRSRTDTQPGLVESMAIKASPYLSWRRAATNGLSAAAIFVGAVGAFMGLRAAGVGPFASLLTAGTLNANAPLLVADFTVTGPDTALSGPLALAMRTSLGQSRVVSIVPISRITDALSLMRREPDSRLDLPLARDIAQREGVKAVVAGTLTVLNGGGYLVSTKLVMASSGDEVAAFQEPVDAAKAILPAIDRLARKLRARIGESPKLVRADPPLAQVTTASLEALKKFTAALQVNSQGDYARALALLQDAIRIDPAFAMAYRQLLNSTGNSRLARIGLGGYPDQSEVLVRTREKLCALRDRLPERERQQAIGSCSGVVPAITDSALRAFPGALNAFATGELMNRRQYARAESAFVRVIADDPATAFAYFNIVSAQIAQGKYDAARVSLDRALRQFPNNKGAQIAEYFYNLGHIDSAEAITRAQATVGFVLNRLYAHNTLSILAARRGRVGDAHTHLAEAHVLEREFGAPPRPLDDSLLAAQFEIVFFERPAAAVRTLDQALAETPLESIGWIPSRPYLRVAALYAQAGRADKAKALLGAYDRAVSDTAKRQQPGRDSALAYIALAERRPRDAIAAFRRAEKRADGSYIDACAVCVEPGIGLALDREGMTDSAIAVLEHFVKGPSTGRKVADAWNLHWALRRLGELHEARGDRADAVKYYQRFVELWKNADPELQPTVRDVRQRLARLTTN
jgi:serine/threonine protein kinase/DNA-binding SARP family transcriptional activator